MQMALVLIQKQGPSQATWFLVSFRARGTQKLNQWHQTCPVKPSPFRLEYHIIYLEKVQIFLYSTLKRRNSYILEIDVILFAYTITKAMHVTKG